MKSEPSKLTSAPPAIVGPSSIPVELWRDRWYAVEASYPLDASCYLIELIDSDELLQQHLRLLPGRKSGSTAYTELRYVLYSLARAQLQKPRRLTWWERITGRLKP